MTKKPNFHAIFRLLALRRRVLPALLCLVLFSCRVTPEDPAQDRNSNTDCQVHLSYDAVTTTLIQPANAADTAQLSFLDRVFTTPKIERHLLSACFSENGDYVVTDELATPPGPPPASPEHTLPTWLKPKYKKVVNQNGRLYYYDASNQLINTNVINSYTTEVFDMLEMFTSLQSLPPITQQDFSDALSLFSTNGMPMTEHADNIVTTSVVQPDGTSSVMVIDKAARMQVGQLNFDLDGKLNTFFMMKVTGIAPNIQVQKMFRVFYFDAVESGVRMEHRSTTEFDTFTLTLN